jgi:hypothetical protein
MLDQSEFELASAVLIVVVDCTSFVATRLPVLSLICSVEILSPALTFPPALAVEDSIEDNPAKVGVASTLDIIFVML